MLKPIFARTDSNISSCLYGINRSICSGCILFLVSMSHAQQKVENRNIFWFNVVELQCNQVDDWLGAPPEIPVIFGAYVYSLISGHCKDLLPQILLTYGHGKSSFTMEGNSIYKIYKSIIEYLCTTCLMICPVQTTTIKRSKHEDRCQCLMCQQNRSPR